MAAADVITASIALAPTDNFHWLNAGVGDLLIRGLNGGGSQKILLGTSAGQDVSTLSIAESTVTVAASVLPSENLTYDIGTADLRFRNVYADQVDISGDTMLGGDLTVQGKLTARDVTYLQSNVYIFDSTEIRSNLIVENDATVNSNLVVFGTSELYGSVQVNSGVTVNSNLLVLGSTELTGSVLVDSGVTVNSNLLVLGSTELTGSVLVDSGVTVNSNLLVLGSTELTGSVLVDSGVTVNSNLLVLGSTELTGSVLVDSGVTVNSNLLVLGSTELTGSVLVDSGVTVNSNLAVLGSTELTGSLLVDSDVTVNSNLAVLGNTELTGSLLVDSGVTVNSNLAVLGSTELTGSLLVDSDVTVNSNLAVLGDTELTGAATLLSTLTMSNATGSQTIYCENGFLGIGGSNVHHTLDVFGSFHVTGGDAFVDGYMSIGNTIAEYPMHVASVDEDGMSMKATGRVSATEFNIYSDRRIKTDIKSLDPSVYLDIVRAMKVREYSYVDNTEKGSLSRPGFIAQELEEVVPHAVQTSSEYVPNVFSNCTVKAADASAVTVELPESAAGKVAAGDKIKCRTSGGSTHYGVVIANGDGDDRVSGLKIEFPVQAPVVAAGDEIFVVGTMVHDFKMLSHDQIGSIAVGAIQAQALEMAAMREELRSLKEELSALRASA